MSTTNPTSPIALLVAGGMEGVARDRYGDEQVDAWIAKSDDVNARDRREMRNQRAEKIAGLRQLADFLEQHPEAESLDDLRIFDYCLTRDALVRKARVLGGRWEKKPGEHYFELHRQIGPVDYQLYTLRGQACEARVVGTVPVTEERFVDPGRAAVLQAELDALTERVVVGERDVVEWDCAPVLKDVAS